jgi:disulfide oxidoreductase YuzD
MSEHDEIRWLPEPEEKNYPAATSYLSLLFDNATVKTLVNKLRKTPITHFKAKDIFRASGLSLLGVSNSHVDKNREKIKDKIELSPILLVRDKNNEKVIIADGYHRMCAVYSYNEDEMIPCKII